MRGFYEKKKDIKKQLMFKYMTIVVLFSIVCLSIGVTLAKRMVVGNSAILLCNFAKETGKNISNIINLEIQKLEMLANTPILQDRNADEEKKMEYLRNMATQRLG